MSSPITHEIHAAAARSVGWSSFVRIAVLDVPFLISFHRLEIAWVDDYVMVKKPGGPGHVERFTRGGEITALFNAVVMCAALVGGVSR